MSNNESDPAKPPPVKLEDLKTPVNAAEMMRSLNEFSGLGKLSAALKQQQKVMDSITRPSGAMKHIFDDIEKQRKLLGHLQGPKVQMEPPSLRSIEMPKLPPNPILETNQKLEGLAAKFEQMLAVMAGAATIANDIQGHAATFLEKFDEASRQTDKSARSAIRIGLIAIVVSVLVSFIPMAVGYFWPDQNLQALENLTKQIATTQNNDRAATARLVETLRQSNQKTIEQLTQAINQLQGGSIKLLPEVK